MRFGLVTCLFAILASAPLAAQDQSPEKAKEEARQADLSDVADIACWREDLATIQRLIAEGWDVNSGGSESRSKPFYVAIESGAHDIVAAMIAAGARLNEPDANGNTALSMAVGNSHRNPSEESSLRMLDYLLENGADVHASGEAAVTAAAGNNLSLVKRLVAAGARPTPESLAAAVSDNKEDVVDYLLQQKVDPKSKLKNNKTLFHSLPEKALFERLLALGLDPNAADDSGRRPVHVAASRGTRKLPVMKLLVEHGADINAADGDGITPVMLSLPNRWMRETEMMHYLVELGARLDLRDKQGRTVLDHAWAKGRWEDVLYFKGHGAGFPDPRERLDFFVRRAASSAVESSTSREIVGWLSTSVDPIADFKPDGRPLTVWFVIMGHSELLDLSIKQGVPVDATDGEGRTALMWAEMTCSVQAKDQLLARGARRDIKDASGKTAGDWADWRAHLEKHPQSAVSDEALVSQVPDLRSGEEQERDAFFAAIYRNQPEELRRQLSSKPGLMKLGQGGLPPLHLAAALGRLEIMDELVRRGAMLNGKSPDGETPMILAVRGGQMAAVSWLLKNAPGVVSGETLPEAGAEAVSMKQSGILRFLFGEGWRPAQGDASLLALQVAVDRDDAALFRLLLEGGAELRPTPSKNLGDENEFASLLRSVGKSTDTAVLKSFFQHLEQPVRDQYQAHLAGLFQSRASNGDVAGVKLCLELGGVDVNARLQSGAYTPGTWFAKEDDRNFTTALGFAAAAGQFETVQYLLQQGAKLEGLGPYGIPLLHGAVDSKNEKLVALLIESGVPLQEKDRQGRTALQFAEFKEHQAIANLLRKATARPSD
ncbi:ankyrin repeat domain-containing protein [Verrucomicrobium sp. BvORR034]|uniref:ankyrin repeat domain-containing protein n=1 Tax=Verrucomicrobium sp. BvORR034 TaxID=1396418 RepID=UPI000678B926|nr:ankyrin repeat domain-containing protein [Verrucomicrobium sp. BvORR034]